jgi:hypothetical protein
LSRVAIFQPCYFAPLYLFQRIVDCDLWVSLLGAQYTRRTPQGVATIAPVRGGTMRLRVACRRGFMPIERTLLSAGRWKQKHLASLRQAYAAAPHADFMLEVARSVLSQPVEILGELNMISMLAVLEFLRRDGIWKGRMVRDSEALPDRGDLRGSAWMLALARALGAREYLSGRVGIESYLDVASFERSGIAVRAQAWTARPYARTAVEGVGSLSILDLLAWRGRRFTEYFVE